MHKLTKWTLSCLTFLITMLYNMGFCQTSNTTSAQTESKQFTYEELNVMRSTLESELAGRVAELKGKTSNHVPPGGSEVMSDNYLMAKMVFIKTDVHVVVSVSRIDFMSVDKQTLTFAAEVALGWKDTNLKWNYSETDLPLYNIVMNPEDIWTPNILPMDLIGYDHIPENLKPSVTVFYNGAVISKVTATIVAPCDVEVLTYPFDTPHCHLRFAQTFDPGARINFIAVPATDKSERNLLFNSQHRHREWDLVYLNSSSHQDGEFYHLEIVLRRKAVFYAIVLIMPCIVLNLLSFLMFFVEVDGTGRVDLALNLILSFFVLLIILVDSIPPSGGDVPLLGLYVTVSTAVVVFMMVGSLVLIGLHKLKVSGKPVPNMFSCLTTKFKMRKSKPMVYEVSTDNNNPVSEKKAFQTELAQLASMDKELEAKNDGEAEEAKMDAVIYNLNFILFVITLIIHIVLIIGVTVIWIMKAE